MRALIIILAILSAAPRVAEAVGCNEQVSLPEPRGETLFTGMICDTGHSNVYLDTLRVSMSVAEQTLLEIMVTCSPAGVAEFSGAFLYDAAIPGNCLSVFTTGGTVPGSYMFTNYIFLPGSYELDVVVARLDGLPTNVRVDCTGMVPIDGTSWSTLKARY